jgi:hypothetical protein
LVSGQKQKILMGDRRILAACCEVLQLLHPGQGELTRYLFYDTPVLH